MKRAYSTARRPRLTAVKNACDPDNVFHLNDNITPTPTGAAVPAPAKAGLDTGAE